MKKNHVLIMVMMVTFLAATFLVMGSSEEDYKVIKNAVKVSSSGDVTWLKISVFDKKANKETVTVKVPFALLEMFTEGKDELKIKEKCDVDFKKVIEILKKSGPTTLVEVDEQDELIKIWVE